MNQNDFQTIFQDNNHTLALTNIQYILNNFKIDNWSKNRAVDLKRVKDIAKYYESNNIKIIPGTIHVWLKNDIYYIYDGLHRFESAKLLTINNPNNEIQLLLSINYSTFEENIISEFANINKSIPIPIIYIDDDDKIKKHICQNLAETFCKNYPKFQSSARKPQTFNFNRDVLIDYFSTFDINFKNENIDIIIYDILINVLNEDAKNYIIKNKINHPKKCDNYNFFLFYLSKEYIKNKVEMEIIEI